MIKARKPEADERPRKPTVAGHVFFEASSLGDERAEDRNDGQDDQEHDGQLDGSEKLYESLHFESFLSVAADRPAKDYK